jgi:hypothetical protein
MIRDLLISQLKERFPKLGFSFDEPPKPVASLQSPCLALGELQILDDGDEATVYFVSATHGHFGCYDETLDAEQREKQIVEDVVEFLDSVFKDRVVIWRALGGMAGGWRVLKPDESAPAPSALRKQFLWSRELT